MAEIEGGQGGGCPPKATKNCINFLGIDPRLAHLSGHCWALPPHRKILATPLDSTTRKDNCSELLNVLSFLLYYVTLKKVMSNNISIGKGSKNFALKRSQRHR